MFSSFSLTYTGLLREIEHTTPPALQLTVEMNGQFTHLVELNPLLVSLGAGVGDPQGSELGPEQVGGVLLHGRDVEAECLGGDPLGAVGEVICRQSGNDESTVALKMLLNISFTKKKKIRLELSLFLLSESL